MHQKGERFLQEAYCNGFIGSIQGFSLLEGPCADVACNYVGLTEVPMQLSEGQCVYYV